ncbi:uncharacterized protein PG998_015077 [Apiospora kogelbergensis]|uniref:uncharacterized protein n=1 Tax=Apiospora kogelbergensis TaxID=1337665 RepID=UPI003130FB35
MAWARCKQTSDAFPPPSVTATWPRPNYVDPPTRGPALLITELTTLSLALVCLALRLWVRVRQLHKAWWDDWVMVVAGVCCAGTTVDVILATQLFGWDRHVWDVPFWMLVQGRKVYLRIALRGTLFLRLTWAAIAANVLIMAVFFILLWPPSSYWNLLRTEQDCISEVPGLMSQTILTVLLDLAVYVLPMPTLYRLSLPVRQRVGLMVLFGLGGVVVVAGCMRTYWVHHVELETYDVTWEGWELWIWAAVEANLGYLQRTTQAPKDDFSGWSAHTTNTTANNGGGVGMLLGWSGGKTKKKQNRRGRGTAGADKSTTMGSATSGMVGGKPYFELVRMEAGTARNSEAPSDRIGSQRHLYEPQDDDTSQESLHLPRQVPDEEAGASPDYPQFARYSGSLQHVYEYEVVGPSSPRVDRRSEAWPLGPFSFERRASWQM